FNYNTMKKSLLLYTLLPFFNFFQSCNIINPKEEIPTYIKIDSVQTYISDFAKHGSVSHAIKDVWVYADNNLLGAFEVPALIPYLGNKTANISIVPGIWANGISINRFTYKFYTQDTFKLEPSPAKQVSKTPKFTYRDNLNFHLLEDFEQGNNFKNFTSDPSFLSDTAISINTNSAEVKDGVASGLIYMNSTNPNSQSITSNQYYFPTTSDAYLELDYKSTCPFVVRLRFQTEGGSYIYTDIIGINEKSNWNKIYLNITEYTTKYQNRPFEFMIQSKLPANASEAKIWIDNFKIVSF
ncbi:MAG: hypothetical protein KA275_03365, partial [Chitinophagaceae bacterium]|nr:hypothetical protein [Chitinophagaceae bacterium]